MAHAAECDAQNFMIQGGDPTGTGRGGTSIYGCARAPAPVFFAVLVLTRRGSFEDEISPALKHTGAGVLSMANSCVALFYLFNHLAAQTPTAASFSSPLHLPPGSMVASMREADLPGKHTIFGRVSSGMSVVRRLGLVKTSDSNDR